MPQPGEPFCPYRVFTGAFIPDAVIEYPKLSLAAKLCWAVLARCAGPHKESWPSMHYVAERLCVTTRQARRIHRELEREGFLQRTPRAGRTNTYVFLWHPVFSTASMLTPDIGVRTPRTLMSGGGGHERPGPLHSIESITESIDRRRGLPVENGEGGTELEREVGKHLKAYMLSNGQPSGREVKAPDREIVRRVVSALNGHSIRELEALLRDRLKAGCRPGMAGGPRGYAWFPAVVAQHFA